VSRSILDKTANPVIVVLLYSVVINDTDMQGKGMRKTYWLVGKDGFGKPLPLPPEQAG